MSQKSRSAIALLSDEEWDYFRRGMGLTHPEDKPSGKGRGRPRVSDRDILNGIFWVMRTKSPWRKMPKEFPDFRTCHRRFRAWKFELRNVLGRYLVDRNAALLILWVSDSYRMRDSQSRFYEKKLTEVLGTRKNPRTRRAGVTWSMVSTYCCCLQEVWYEKRRRSRLSYQERKRRL